MIVSVWKYRSFIWQNALRDLWVRNAGSAIGFFWNVINPLFQILLYTLVFSRLMQIRFAVLPFTYGFAIYLCAGLVPWLCFSETVVRCTNSLHANSQYLKKLSIPEQIFVAQDALSSFFSLLIGMVVLVCVCLFLGYLPSWTWFSLLPVLVMLQCFGFGLGLLLSVLNVFFKDIGQGFALVMQLWFWATPIVYQESILPEMVRQLLWCNPVYPYINTLHIIIVEKQWPAGQSWLIMLLLALCMPLAGYLLLKKLRAEIRDVL